MEKQRWEESKLRESEGRRSAKRRSEKRRSEKRRCRCAERQKRRETLCFSDVLGSGGSKSRLSKAAGLEPSGEMRDEQLHAVVARSRFRSQKAKNTLVSEHFWKLSC